MTDKENYKSAASRIIANLSLNSGFSLASPLARIFAAMLRVGDEALRVLMVVQPRVWREHAGLALGEVHAHRLIILA